VNVSAYSDGTVVTYTTGESVDEASVLVPPIIGSQDDHIGTPESCCRTVGNESR
jgi:hypothetical protein